MNGNTAQKSNVNDIRSLPDRLAQTPQANTSPVNSTDDSSRAPITQKPSGGKFGRPGLAGSDELTQGVSEVDLSSGPVEITLAPEQEKSTEIYQAPEILTPPEVGERLKPAEARKPGEKTPQSPQVVQPEEPPARGKIVDRRTGKEKLHRVAETADKTTKTADIKEQEFIEGVEQVHSIV